MTDNNSNSLNNLEVTSEFNSKSQITNESLAEEKTRLLEGMRQELKNLEENRTKYVPAMNYTIGGTTETDKHRQIEAERETRINELRTALENANNHSNSK